MQFESNIGVKRRACMYLIQYFYDLLPGNPVKPSGPGGPVLPGEPDNPWGPGGPTPPGPPGGPGGPFGPGGPVDPTTNMYKIQLNSVQTCHVEDNSQKDYFYGLQLTERHPGWSTN